ncbi:hypothetical protein [Cupriavidus taiwanensis]|uniref:hypothetical protein n=1 Tax=Cupriavidus taiwanensis TaxID=164546 RepID=UPI000E10AA37|nr:hypothetical protein [Cupriavidus taiwanensis]SOY56814.1 conserved hypothetical protein [Cupriavidus taiwanensis]SOY90716.1 conserved hypothetical protein [Cupriavidus taiwanensis]SOZ63521.1 conserved hypothetical protein [Cupriavidus taiwanensis]SOZ82536.1 conserved hypothetical protein [Cupriavidus taiwanensis]SOZ84406.1 conserved hypothetical protein [Cupriavidus taiwanensis]
MKLFTVEVSVIAVVMAESLMDAHSVAVSEMRDIVRDTDPDIDVHGELKALDRLPEGWDPMCLPYGGDGETRLKDLLPGTEPVRDTHTIDMFETEATGSPA